MLNLFLDSMDETTIIALSRLNSRIRYLIDLYSGSAWDFLKFARNYVRKPGAFLTLIDGRNSLVYGEAVTRFFLRQPAYSCTLNICASVTKIYLIQRFLVSDGYELIVPADSQPMHDTIRTAVDRAFQEDHTTWDMTGDRSSHLSPFQEYTFDYVKGTGSATRSICLRLVRVEPYRFVLNSNFSKYSSFSFKDVAIPICLRRALSVKLTASQ